MAPTGTAQAAAYRRLRKDRPDLLERVLSGELPQAQRQGRPGKESGTCFNPDDTGNASAQSVVRRLKRDDPELAGRVVRGEVTPNAAALLKGWRKPRIVVTTPDAVARQPVPG